ncbi:MAG: MarR family winged helix-turn-helix transcriptional regulator [Phycisphaerales bacterium]|nr:MarR family winged helix-turn-helix transcriptional regulator [Phycisphaerales bacterium]
METTGFIPKTLSHNVSGGIEPFNWAESLPGQILYAARSVNSRLAELLAPHELSVSEARALIALVRDGPMNQQSLAASLGVTKGNIVQLVDRLSERGLVERVKRADDRRENTLAITPAGKTHFDKTMPDVDRWFRDTMSTIPVDQRTSCSETLHLVATLLRPERA